MLGARAWRIATLIRGNHVTAAVAERVELELPLDGGLRETVQQHDFATAGFPAGQRIECVDIVTDF